MFGITFQEIEKVNFEIIPDPQIQEPHDVIVQVEMAGLCGSDLHPFWGREKGLLPGTVMGHELVGRIVDVGSDVKKLQMGDRVFAPFSTNCGHCFYCVKNLPSRCAYGQLFGWRGESGGLHGAQAQFVRVPLADGTLLPVPANVSHELALFLGDNLSTGYFCADMIEPQPEGAYVVIGCGNVGLMAILALRSKGCQNIIAIDSVEQRQELAASLGAIAISPGREATEKVMRLTDHRGADGVLELVGMAEAQRAAFELVRPGGTLATVGCHCDRNFSFSPVDAYDKNLTYRTGRCPARYYMEALGQESWVHNLDLTPFVTHYFELNDGPRAYEVFSQRKEGIVKGVFDLR